jgi:hypothetical protein
MTYSMRRWWACQPHAPSAFTPGMFLVLIFTRAWVDPRAMERSEGDMSLKNPVTQPRLNPGTVWLVARSLNHYATPGPSWNSNVWKLHLKVLNAWFIMNLKISHFLWVYDIFTDATFDTMLKTFQFDFKALKSSNRISVVSQTTVIWVLFNCMEYM